MDDVGADPLASNAETPPDRGQDLPLVPGQTVVDTSASAHANQEVASAKDPGLIQVSGYNGMTSPLPYMLRVRSTASQTAPACPAYTRTGGVTGTLPNLATLPPRLATLVLVNRQRLGDTYGQGAANAVMGDLATLAQASGVDGAVLPVEGDGSVAQAYAAWNSDPCSTGGANGVVKAITNLVDRIRAGDPAAGVLPHPGLRNIVLVGADDIVPMGRLDDTTRVGNERGYADSVGNGNEYSAALATGHILSDDPYGDLDPVPFLNRRLYVPDVAVGRLVVSPADIHQQIQSYVDSGGVLTPQHAYASGYDFMANGASDVRSALTQSLTTAAGGTPPAVSSRIAEDWTANQLLGDLNAAPPDVGAVYAHFGHTSGLSAAGFTNGDTFSGAQLAASLPVGSRMLFSMGCHAGLNVSDAAVAGSANDDVTQNIAGRGAVFVATTGFGYGDQVTVGLHERLFVLFARQLDGAVTAGQAMALAKQQYFASQGLYGAYDEKALETTTFYGLPMYRIGNRAVTRPSPTGLTPTPVTGTQMQAADVSLHPTFSRQTGATGDYFTVDGPSGTPVDPQVTANRPIEPRLDVDVTSPTGPASLPAHGALLTDLTTGTVTPGFDAAFSRPTLDDSAHEPEVTSADLAFPSRMATVTTFTAESTQPTIDPTPQRQRLVVVPGQYFSEGTADPAGIGIQRLYSDVNVRVLYSTSTDYTAPTLTDVTSSISGGALHLSAAASDTSGVQRVVALYNTGNGDWQPLELSQSAGSTWAADATVPAGTTSAEVIVQAVDAGGNVGVSANKGHLFQAAPPASASVGPASVPEGSSGSTTVSVPVTLDRPSDTAITVDYVTSDGSARAPSDYGTSSGTVTFAPGQTTKSIPISVVGDVLVEPDEDVTVTLRDPTAAVVGTATATVTITNDDVDLAPAAHAGDDRDVRPADQFFLDGSASQDPEGLALSYRWTQLSGTPATITNADTAKATVAGGRPRDTLVFRPTVTDPAGHTAIDDITISPK